MALRTRSGSSTCRFATLVMLTAVPPLTAAISLGDEYFVAPGGSDENPGTLEAPFASIARGQQAASPGDTVWLRGGVYEFVGGGEATPNAVQFNKSGNEGARINYWAYPGETPIFDFFNYKPQARSDGFSVQADYLHFKGLELRGVRQQVSSAGAGIRVEGGGDYNIFEQLDLHHHQGLGLWIDDGAHNLVLNSDSHHNYDPLKNGGDADGFGTRTTKPGNKFVGARAWQNSDDGFDIIFTEGQTVIENSWAWHNGYIPDTNTPAGNGAGFKSGGFLLDPNRFPDPEDVPRHVIRGNLAFDNRVQGFYANHHPGGLDFINNTAFDNTRGFDLLNDVQVPTWPADHFLRNNISFSNGTDVANARFDLIDDEYNSWNEGFSAAAADFVSLSPVGVDGPRQADGSLPELQFLRLAEGSGLIDAGIAAGLPFMGFGPDLGAFETQADEPVPGDIDGDGDVDAFETDSDLTSDLDILATNFRSVGNRHVGDLTGDGYIDLADFRAWKSAFAVSAASARGAGAPEPSSTMVCLWAFLVLGLRR